MKYKCITFIASFLFNATDNYGQIPPAPNIVGFYNREIAKFDRQLEPLKMKLTFKKEWATFEQSYFISKPEWIKESKKLQSERKWYQQLEINPSLAYIGLSKSDAEFMRKNFQPTLQKMKDDLENGELIHAKKIDYELKREFLKKLESKK